MMFDLITTEECNKSTIGYQFGMISKEELADKLVDFAARLRSGKVIPQQLSQSGSVEIMDFTLRTFAITYAEQNAGEKDGHDQQDRDGPQAAAEKAEA